MKNIWKYRTLLLAVLLLALTLAGCGQSQGNAGNSGSENNGNGGDTRTDAGEDSSEGAEKDAKAALSSGEADYDLTAMTSEMVYATVYQMMNAPESYVGKTVKMKGTYAASYYEPTEKYYHYCVIQDATACCAQGLEFVWDDGNHAYPEEYPQEDTEIVVEGVFETYTEEGDSYVYTRLRDSSMEVSQ